MKTTNKSPWTAYREGEASYFASMHQRAGTTPVRQGDDMNQYTKARDKMREAKAAMNRAAMMMDAEGADVLAQAELIEEELKKAWHAAQDACWAVRSVVHKKAGISEEQTRWT